MKFLKDYYDGNLYFTNNNTEGNLFFKYKPYDPNSLLYTLMSEYSVEINDNK